MELSLGKVSFYLPSLRGGGAERVMVTLANGFVDRGIDVDLVLAKAEGPYLADVNQGVRVIDLKAGRVLASLPRLVTYLWRERPKAMVSALDYANVVASLATKLSGHSTRLIVSEHSTPSRAREHGTRKSVIVRALVRPAYSRCHGIVAVSDGVASDLSEEFGISRDGIHTIYNPIVGEQLITRSFEPVPEMTNLQGPVILAVGRLTAAKDYPTLLRAFSLVRKKRNANLIILGDGELRQELQSLATRLGISGAVSMPGFVGNPYAWMRHSDVFVMSSAWEGLPTVLVEAMACGTPVVSTDCPSGPREILEGGKWGRLVPVGAPDQLAEAIAATLTDTTSPDVAKRAADFSVDNAVDRYLHLLKS